MIRRVFEFLWRDGKNADMWPLSRVFVRCNNYEQSHELCHEYELCHESRIELGWVSRLAKFEFDNVSQRHYQRALSLRERAQSLPQNSLISPQESPISPQKNPISPQKSLMSATSCAIPKE